MQEGGRAGLGNRDLDVLSLSDTMELLCVLVALHLTTGNSNPLLTHSGLCAHLKSVFRYTLYTLFHFPEFCSAVNVQQRPRHAALRQAESVTLDCEHDDSNFYYMFWYRQTGSQMRMLASSMGKNVSTVEAGPRYAMSRPNLTYSSLEIRQLEGQDSAVYLCASRTGTLTQSKHMVRKQPRNHTVECVCVGGGGGGGGGGREGEGGGGERGGRGGGGRGGGRGGERGREIQRETQRNK